MQGPDILQPSQSACCKFPETENLKSVFSSDATHGEEDDDSGAGVVVLAAAVHQADGVKQRGEQRPHIREVSRLKCLGR